MDITLANRVTARAKQLDLNAPTIATLAEINRSTVYDIMSGQTENPNPDKLDAIASVLNCDRCWLQFGVGKLEGDEPSSTLYPSNEPEQRQAEEVLDVETGKLVRFIDIEVMDVNAGMGSGMVFDDHNIESEISKFREDWIPPDVNAKPSELKIITVKGDSMEPTLNHQDAILIDTTDKTPSSPGLYVLNDGTGLVAKRLQAVAFTDPPKVRVISDNKHYAAYERLVDEINIVGRIRWFGRMMN